MSTSVPSGGKAAWIAPETSLIEREAARLFEAASALDWSITPSMQASAPKPLSDFAERLLDWLFARRSLSRQDPTRRDKTSLLLHCMAGAQNLGDAIQLYARFSPVLWPDRMVHLERVDEGVMITLDPPEKKGDAAFLGSLWALSLLIHKLEWLVGGAIDGIAVTVGRPCRSPPDAGHPHEEVCRHEE